MYISINECFYVSMYLYSMVWTSFQYISVSRYFMMILFLFLFGSVFRNCVGCDANNCEQCERCEHYYCQQRSHCCHDSARIHVEIRHIHSTAHYSIQRGWDACMYVCMHQSVYFMRVCIRVCMYVCMFVNLFFFLFQYFFLIFLTPFSLRRTS